MSRSPSPLKRRLVHIVSGATVAGLVIATAVVSGPGQSGASIGRYLSNRTQATSFLKDPKDNGGEALVSGPAQEQYDNRAIPNSTIAFPQTAGSINAFQALSQRKSKVKDNGQSWQLIGPTVGNVPPLATYTNHATVVSGRVSALALASTCVPGNCRLLVGAAGGGVWVTSDALANPPSWHASSSGLTSNAIGSLAFDPNDPSGKTVYVGTGEPNGSGDSEAGVGLFKSTNGGASWRLVSGSVAVSANRSIGSIVVDPGTASHLYIGTDVARHGSSSVNGGRFTPPGAPSIGIYESKNGGVSWTQTLQLPQDTVNPVLATGGDLFKGGIPQVVLDPTDPTTVYAATFSFGVMRRSPTNDGDMNFHQILAPVHPNDTLERSSIALTTNNGHTRVYAARGPATQTADLWRVDNADTLTAAALLASQAAPGTGGWVDLSNSTPGTPGFSSFNFCYIQCSYDMPIATPAGHPDSIWIGGAMQYPEIFTATPPSNGRAIQRSVDGGVHFTDMTNDMQAPFPLGMHPDQHAILFDPANPDIAFIGSDGGVVRTSGQFADASSQCDSRGLSGADLTDCKAWLKQIPTQIFSLNAGLATLQYQSVSLNPHNSSDLLAGTQDNGTWSFTGSNNSWFETINGDGGQSGIDPANASIRMHTYFDAQIDVNFHGTQTQAWDWISDPFFVGAGSGEARSFYIPIITDPTVGGSMFVGLQRVWRTQDNGGSQAFLDAHCNEYGIPPFGSDQVFTGTCGDWQPLGTHTLTGSFYALPGGDLKGSSYVVAVSRAASDKNVLWAATRRGRLFVSTNAQAADPSTVTFHRLDTAAQPTRFISGIAIDPANAYHAFVSFSGYSAYSPGGHVYEVTVNPTTLVATWADRSFNLGDQPITGIQLDAKSGALYVSTDFGVGRLDEGDTSWVAAAPGLPPVAVYGITIDSKNHWIYAATHGRSIYRLHLQ